MTLRILSYNVRYFAHTTRGLFSTKSAIRRIADAISNLAEPAHVACLQEVETSSLRSSIAHGKQHKHETQLDHLMHLLTAAFSRKQKENPYQAFYFPSHDYQLAPGLSFYTTGLAILAHKSLQIAHVNEPASITHHRVRFLRSLKQTRICAHVRVSHPSGESVDIFNTHLSLPAAFSRDFWMKEGRLGFGNNQLEEAKKLMQFVNQERQGDAFIVTGDFNSTPASPVYRYLTEDAGLADPFRSVANLSLNQLHNTPTAGFLAMRMRLDHLLGGRAIKWVDVEGSHDFDDRESPFFGLSDHMPVLGRITLQPPRSVADK